MLESTHWKLLTFIEFLTTQPRPNESWLLDMSENMSRFHNSRRRKLVREEVNTIKEISFQNLPLFVGLSVSTNYFVK